MRKLGVLYRELGLTERTDALEYTTGVVGRPIASRNQLTKVEAGQLIDHMEKSVISQTAAA
jgi:hypothetical protein